MSRLAWQSDLLATACKNPPTIKEGKWVKETVTVPFCQNHSWIELKPIAKIKIGQLVWHSLCRSISYCTCSCCHIFQVFFCHCTDFLHDIYIQCYSDCTKYYAAKGVGWRWGGETFGMRWVDRRTAGRKELRWPVTPDWHTAATISGGEESVWMDSQPDGVGSNYWSARWKGDGRDRGWRVIQMEKQYRGWSWVGGVWRRPPASPIGPFHPAGVWRLRRSTWVCSRSWGWATVVVSSSGLSSAPLLLSLSATAPPSCPSPLRRRCYRWACGEGGERGRWFSQRRCRKGKIDWMVGLLLGLKMSQSVGLAPPNGRKTVTLKWHQTFWENLTIKMITKEKSINVTVVDCTNLIKPGCFFRKHMVGVPQLHHTHSACTYFGCCCGVRPLDEVDDDGVLDECPWWLLWWPWWPWCDTWPPCGWACAWECEDCGVEPGYCGVPRACWLGVV